MTSLNSNKQAGNKPTAIQQLARWWNTRQRKWADLLNRSTAHWTGFQKKLALVLFLITTGANSGIIVYRTLTGKSSTRTLKPDAIRTIPLQTDTFFLSHIEERRLLLKQKIDSLAKTDSGHMVLERLKVRQPGLWDSLHFFLKQP